MANRILAAVMDNLDALIVDLDTVQGLLDLVRTEIAANGATYADAAAQLEQARGRLVEALLHAAARRAPPQPDEQYPAVLDQFVADLAELVNRRVLTLLEGEEVVPMVEEEVVPLVMRLELGYVDPEMVARTVDYLQTVVRVERIRHQARILVVAQVILVVVRAAAFATARAPLVAGVLLTAAVAYALAYAASGGAVVPGPASIVRISALVLCFLFGVPVVGNLA